MHINPFDRGIAVLSENRAPKLYIDLNPFHAVKRVVGGVKDAVVGAGHAIGNLASNPWVQGLTAAGLAATGVGAPLAAGIMAAERGGGALLKPGGNIGQGIAGAAQGAAMGAGAAKAGSLLTGGLQATRRVLGGGVPDVSADPANASSPGGAPDGGNWWDPVVDAGGAVLNGTKRVLGGGSGGGGALDVGLAALAAQQGVASARASARSGELSDRALSLAEQNWGAGAPLRAAGLSGLLNRTHPNLSAVYADPTNPLAGNRRPLAARTA